MHLQFDLDCNQISCSSVTPSIASATQTQLYVTYFHPKMETLILIISVFAVHTVTTVSSSNLTDSEVHAFDAPLEFKNKFPYYLSGYDEDGAPIWIIEGGKWDMRKYLEQGGKYSDAMDIYVHQMFLNFRDSGLNSTGKQFVIVCDVDGFNIRQAGDAKTVQFMFSTLVLFEEIARSGTLKKVWVLNANVLFERIWQIGSRVLGQLANYVEIYGTNKEKWKPKLLKELPRDQIPEWYGGLPSHKPLKVFG